MVKTRRNRVLWLLSVVLVWLLITALAWLALFHTTTLHTLTLDVFRQQLVSAAALSALMMGMIVMLLFCALTVMWGQLWLLARYDPPEHKNKPFKSIPDRLRERRVPSQERFPFVYYVGDDGEIVTVKAKTVK